MFIGRVSRRARASVVEAKHPISIFTLMRYDDDELIIAFHILLDEIKHRQFIAGYGISVERMMKTAQNIMELVFRDHGGWAFLQLGQDEQYFLQQMQQQHLLTLPQQNFTINQQPQQSIEYRQQAAKPIMGQAGSQDIIVRQQGAQSPNQQQVSSNQEKHESFLGRFNKDNERNEKMKNRYADELALKARAELEAEEKKAIEIERENARKLEEAEERLRKTRIENERKEHTLMRTDEAISKADELKRQVLEMTEKAEQEKRDSERRIEERCREAAARRDQDRQRSLDNTRNRTGEWDRKTFGYENSQMQRGFTDMTIERGYVERELYEGKETREGNWRFDGDNKREDNYRQRMLLENTTTQESSPTPPKFVVPYSDDDGFDSDEEKRQDPYKLIGLPDRERTPMKDIKTTQRILNRIHQNSIETAVEEATRKHSEKRLVQIKWAADILLDEMNRRAYDEDGAIHPHEQQIWKKKNGFSDAGSAKYALG